MKIDHLVVNVDPSIQEDQAIIKQIQDMGLPYKPQWGKGTRGFKVSNIWIGREYFELVRIKKNDGGGWIREWTDQYLQGHRGLIGFALEVDNIEETWQKIRNRHIPISTPEPLQFRWMFNLLTKTMPWRNAYLPPFSGVPFQFFLQQMDDEKARNYMEQYMVPNSRDEHIEGIAEVVIYGQLTSEDKEILFALFDDYDEQEDMLTIKLGSQCIRFRNADTHKVEVILNCKNEKHADQKIQLSNLEIRNSAYINV